MTTATAEKSKTFKLAAIFMLFAALSLDASAAGLLDMISGTSTLINSLAKLLNIAAALTGAWFVISGVMTWKKSSNEHGGQIEFKSVVIPIVAGTILVAFTGFIAMTSTTFGFASPNTAMFLGAGTL